MAITTRPLKDFLPMVLPHAPACPQPVAEQNLRLSAIELCERALCWRHIITTDITENGGVIAAPDFATVHKIETSEFNGSTLTPIQFSEINHDEDGSVTSGSPSYITQVEDNTYTVYPFQPGKLRLTVFLKPRSGSDYGRVPHDTMQDYYNQVPEFMFTQYAEIIADGALSRILSLPNQSYTDGPKAIFYMNKFDQRVQTISASGMKGQQRSPLRSRPSFF